MSSEEQKKIAELVVTVQKLKNQLEEERKSNFKKTSSMQKTIADTDELARNLKNTTLALTKERQNALARIEKEQFLSRLVEKINSSFSLEEILSSCTYDIGQYLNVDRCGILLFRSEEVLEATGLIVHEYVSKDWEREFDKAHCLDNDLIKKARLTKSTIKENVILEKSINSFLDDVKSYISVALKLGDELIGILYVQQCARQRDWGQKEQDLLESTSLPLATATERAILYKKANARREREELLNRLTTRIRSSLNLEEILSRTVSELGQALNVDRCFLYFDGGIGEEYCREGIESIGSFYQYFILDKLVETESEISTIAIDNLLIEENLTKLEKDETEQLLRTKARSAMAIPLHYQNILHGWLIFHAFEKRHWSENEIRFVEAVGSQVIVAMTQSGMYEKLNSYQEKISRELKQAARVQTALIGGDVFDAELETSVFYKAHSNVSGDFYWIAELSPHIIGVLIGDVSGKGPAAALLTGYLLGEFNSAITSSSIAWYPEKMINFLCRSVLYQNASSDFYATAWYGIFNLSTGEVTYSNGGHLNPYLIKGKEVIHLDVEEDPGVPLGLLDPREINESYESRKLVLDPKDKMILFTDGLVDQKMPNGEFVPKDWILKSIEKNKHKGVQDITYNLNERLNELSGDTPLTDDRLMICLEHNEFVLEEFNAEDPNECEKLIEKIVSQTVKQGMPETKVVDLKLGLTEAFANAIKYGLRKNPYGKIRLGYKISESSFKISILDPGPGFNWQLYNYTSIDEVRFEDEGGRGIPLLHEIFDKVTWNPAGNQVGLFFYW